MAPQQPHNDPHLSARLREEIKVDVEKLQLPETPLIPASPDIIARMNDALETLHGIISTARVSDEERQYYHELKRFEDEKNTLDSKTSTHEPPEHLEQEIGQVEGVTPNLSEPRELSYSSNDVYRMFAEAERATPDLLSAEDKKSYHHVNESITSALEFIARAKQGYQFVPEETELSSRFLDSHGASYQMVIQAALSLTEFAVQHKELLEKRLARPFSPPAPEPEPEPEYIPVPRHQQIDHKERTIDTPVRRFVAKATGLAVAGASGFAIGVKALLGIAAAVVYFPIKWTIVKPIQALWKHALKPALEKVHLPPWVKEGAVKAYNGFMDWTLRPLGRLLVKICPPFEAVGNWIHSGYTYIKKRYEAPTQIQTNCLNLRTIASTTQLWCQDPKTKLPITLKGYLARYPNQGIKESDFFAKKKVGAIVNRGNVPFNTAHCEYYANPGTTESFPLASEHTVTRVSFFNQVGEPIHLDEPIEIEEGILGIVRIHTPAELAKKGVKTLVYQIENRTGDPKPPETLCGNMARLEADWEQYLSEERESYQQALALVTSVSERFELMSDYETHKGFISTSKRFPKAYIDAAGSNAGLVLDALRMGTPYYHARHLMNQMAVAGVPTLLLEGVSQDPKQPKFSSNPSITPMAVLADSFEPLNKILQTANAEAQIDPGILSWPEYFSILSEARTPSSLIDLQQTAQELHYRLQGKVANMYLESPKGQDFSVHALIKGGLDAIADRFRDNNSSSRSSRQSEIGESLYDPELREKAHQIARLSFYFQTEKVFSRCLEQGSLAEARWYMQHRSCPSGSYSDGFDKLPEEYQKLQRWNQLDRFLDVTAEALAQPNFSTLEKELSMAWVSKESVPVVNLHDLLYCGGGVYNSSLPLIQTKKLLPFVTPDNVALLSDANLERLALGMVHGYVTELRSDNRISINYDCRTRTLNSKEIKASVDPQDYAKRLLHVIETLHASDIQMDAKTLNQMCRSLILTFKYFHGMQEKNPDLGYDAATKNIAKAFSLLNNYPGHPHMQAVLEILDSRSREAKNSLRFLVSMAPEGSLDFVSNQRVTSAGNRALSSLIADRLLSDFDVQKDYKEFFEDIETNGFVVNLQKDKQRLSDSLIPVVVAQLKEEQAFVINYPDSKTPASKLLCQFSNLASAQVARTVTEIVKRGGITESRVKESWPKKREQRVAAYLAKNVKTGNWNGKQVLYVHDERYSRAVVNPADIPTLTRALFGSATLGNDERLDLTIAALQQDGYLQSPLEESMSQFQAQFEKEFSNFARNVKTQFIGRRNLNLEESIHNTYQEYLTNGLSPQELHYGYLWLAGALMQEAPQQEPAQEIEDDDNDLLEPLIAPSRISTFEKRHPAMMQSVRNLIAAGTQGDVNEALAPLASSADSMRFSDEVSDKARRAMCLSYVLSYVVENTFHAPRIASINNLNIDCLELIDNLNGRGKPTESVLWNTLFSTRLKSGYPGYIRDVAQRAQKQVASMRRNMQQRHRTLYGKYILHESGSIRPQAHSGDFEEFSSYRPGDDIRKIDWKASARSDRLMTRKFREEEERPQVLVIDLEWLTEGYQEWASVDEENQHKRSQMYPQLERLFTILTLAYEEDVPLSLELRSRALVKRYDNVAGSIKRNTAPEFMKDSFIGELARILAKANAVYESERDILGDSGVKGMNVFAPGDTLSIPKQTRVIAGIHSKNLNQTDSMLKSLERQQRFIQVLRKHDPVHTDHT